MSNLIYPTVFPAVSVNTITPFTIRDGATYLEILEALREQVVALTDAVIDLDERLTLIEESVEEVVENTYAQVYSYKYGSAVPSNGQVYVSAWNMTATELRISETTDDGAILSFGVLSSASTADVRLVTSDGKVFKARITGPSVDNGTYRTIPITPTQVVGTVPGATTPTNVAVVVTL